MKFLKIIISFLLLIFLNHCIVTEPFYLITEGKEQFYILFNRQPFKDYTFYDKYKEKFQEIERIKEFSKNFLKLNVKDHYSSIVEINRNSVSYIVIASDKLSFNAKSYWFPFVGRIYYIGFFDIDRAKRYADYLKNQDYDVKISGVQGYSMLGWFSDPLFSYHLSYSEEELARYMIHELTHSTFWLKDNNKFNENLASFVELEGTTLYLQKYYDEPKIKIFRKKISEEEQLEKLLYIYKLKLKEVYEDQTLSIEEKFNQKREILFSLKNQLLNLKKSFSYYDINHLIKKEFNNADFVLMNLYIDPKIQSQLRKILLECNQKFDCFWQVLNSKFK
jgi:predicted aminopeptidase